jgi:hypothetical protein
MKPSRHSVRFRLVIWYSTVMVVMLGIFSVVLFFLLKDNLFRQMNMSIDSDIEKASEAFRTMFSETDEIEEIKEYGATGMMLLMEGNTPLFISRSWSAEKLPYLFQQPLDRFYSVRSEKDNRYRMKTMEICEKMYLTIGQDEKVVWNTLKAFGMILGLVFPLGLASSGLGGYFLTGRGEESQVNRT